MNEYETEYEEKQEEQDNQEPKYCLNFNNYSAKDQSIIYLLWKINNKKLSVGSLIFYEELKNNFGLTKTHWNLVKEFLSGANLVVNEVVIQNTVSKELISRFGVMNE